MEVKKLLQRNKHSPGRLRRAAQQIVKDASSEPSHKIKRDGFVARIKAQFPGSSRRAAVQAWKDFTPEVMEAARAPSEEWVEIDRFTSCRSNGSPGPQRKNNLLNRTAILSFTCFSAVLWLSLSIPFALGGHGDRMTTTEITELPSLRSKAERSLGLLVQTLARSAAAKMCATVTPRIGLHSDSG